MDENNAQNKDNNEKKKIHKEKKTNIKQIQQQPIKHL